MINQKFRFGKKKNVLGKKKCFDDRERRSSQRRQKESGKKKQSGLKVVKNARTYFEDNDRL